MIESQLFGHIKGSFTGANADKVGFIGQAHGGSILLDEIGEMPADLQPKLLRVLQEKVYYRVGSDKPQEADFRLICSTNRDPFESIKDGNLRRGSLLPDQYDRDHDSAAPRADGRRSHVGRTLSAHVCGEIQKAEFAV